MIYSLLPADCERSLAKVELSEVAAAGVPGGERRVDPVAVV